MSLLQFSQQPSIISLNVKTSLVFTFLYRALQYNYTLQTTEMHISEIDILNLIFDAFYMFRTRGFIFRKTVVYTVAVRYILYVSV
jgi:hypothetical protein